MIPLHGLMCVTGSFRAGIAAVTQDRKGNGSIFRHIRTRHLLHQVLLRRLRLETLTLHPAYFVAIACDLKSVRQCSGGGLVHPRTSITGGCQTGTCSAKRDAGYDGRARSFAAASRILIFGKKTGLYFYQMGLTLNLVENTGNF